MYTKKDWTVQMYIDNGYVIGTEQGQGYLRLGHITTLDDAKRACHCVNNFDELLEACKDAYDLMMKSGAFMVDAPIFKKMESVISKAEKQG